MNKRYTLPLLCLFSAYGAPKNDPKRVSSYVAVYAIIQEVEHQNPDLFQAFARSQKQDIVLNSDQKKELEIAGLFQDGNPIELVRLVAKQTFKLNIKNGSYELGGLPFRVSDK